MVPERQTANNFRRTYKIATSERGNAEDVVNHISLKMRFRRQVCARNQRIAEVRARCRKYGPEDVIEERCFSNDAEVWNPTRQVRHFVSRRILDLSENVEAAGSLGNRDY